MRDSVLLFFFLVAGLVYSPQALAQLKDQDLDGVTVKARKLDVRQIVDSINKNAPANYTDPEVLAGNYTAQYSRPDDTVFFLKIPAFLFKDSTGKYGRLQRDSTQSPNLIDRRSTKAHYDRTLLSSVNAFPEGASTAHEISRLYKIENTDNILYGRAGTEEDPYFYLLFRQEKKKGIPLLIRPFISAIDKDSLVVYSLLKIRRKNWVLVSHENAMLVADPAVLKELIKTPSFARAKELIEQAKERTNLRRFIQYYEWQPQSDGRYHPARSMFSDNLLNISFAIFRKFPDPQGYILTTQFVADENLTVPPKGVLKTYSITDFSKDRDQYLKK